jgi:GAF domain-containing protein
LCDRAGRTAYLTGAIAFFLWGLNCKKGMEQPQASAINGELMRLAFLQNLNILDTPIEERYERITRIACRVLGVPIAALVFVDATRQWFKSIQGVPLTELPRNISFCDYTIQGNEILIVPNATLDDRFKDGQMVVGDLQIRFYAGCPLQISNGIRVGTLCVFDRQPRQLQADDVQFLKDLADSAIAQIKADMLKAFL